MIISSWLRDLSHSLATNLPLPRPSTNRRRRETSGLNVEQLELRSLLSAGVLDPTFGTGGVVTTALAGTQFGRDVAIYPAGTAQAGKIVVGGQTGGDPQFLLHRYNADGTLDTSFDRDGVVTTNLERSNRYESINAIAIQPDGKIVAGGFSSTNIGGVSSVNSNWRLARFNTNGSLDKTFDGDGKVALFPNSGSAAVTDLLIQPDGKIVAIGSNNGQAVIVRFLATGTLDTSFDGDGIASVAAAGITSVARQAADGKLVIAGSVMEAGTTDIDVVDSAFWRFNTNGTLDASFGSGGRVVLSLVANARDSAVGLAIQPADGKILAILDHSAAPGAAVHPGVVTVRIGSTGALDTTYGINGVARTSNGYIAPGKFFVATYVGALSIQPDGKPVVAVQGQSADLNPDGKTYTGTTFSAVLRYSPDGVLDNTWASTTQVIGTASGTGEVSGTLLDSFTFTAPTGAVTSGDTITATFTADNPITVSGDVAGQVIGTFTGTAWRKSFNATEETWQVDANSGAATGTVIGTVTGTVTGVDTVTGVGTVSGAVVVKGTGTAASITNTTKGTAIGTNTGAFTGRFASRFTVTGQVTGTATGGVVQNPAVRGRNHVALQPDGKVVIMGHNGDGTDIVMARYLGDPPLQAASTPAHQRSTTVTAVQVQPILAEAIARWNAAGADTSRLGNVTVQIVDLDSGYLGMTDGNTITLDDNAAGWGWFVDRTPRNDSEFRRPGNHGEQNRMDLLSVLMHEVGHLLQHDHEVEGVMAETLEAGVRHAHIPREHFTLTDTFFEYSGDQGFEMWLGESQVQHQKFTRPASPRSGMTRRR